MKHLFYFGVEIGYDWYRFTSDTLVDAKDNFRRIFRI